MKIVRPMLIMLVAGLALGGGGATLAWSIDLHCVPLTVVRLLGGGGAMGAGIGLVIYAWLAGDPLPEDRRAS